MKFSDVTFFMFCEDLGIRTKYGRAHILLAGLWSLALAVIAALALLLAVWLIAVAPGQMLALASLVLYGFATHLWVHTDWNGVSA